MIFKKISKHLISKIATIIAPDRWKKFNELKYWRGRKKTEGLLSNQHYKFFYTTHFGFTDSDFNNKRILDIGCGPRGSLEWATMAARRIGLDPLAGDYLKLGSNEHQMEYLISPSEHIPLSNDYFDFVTSFNSLDHVENVDKSISEIKRVLKSNGHFLLLVEVNQKATICEPHEITPRELIDKLKPELQCKDMKFYKPMKNGMYASIQNSNLFKNNDPQGQVGYLSALFKKA